MHLWIALVASAVVTLVLGAAFLWQRARRLHRQLADAKRQADELGSLVVLEHQTNYRMACKLYGRAAVDRAMRAAKEKGSN